MVALTDQPEKVAKIIEARGGTPIIVNSGSEGVRMETSIAKGTPMDIPMA